MDTQSRGVGEVGGEFGSQPMAASLTRCKSDSKNSCLWQRWGSPNDTVDRRHFWEADPIGEKRPLYSWGGGVNRWWIAQACSAHQWSRPGQSDLPSLPKLWFHKALEDQTRWSCPRGGKEPESSFFLLSRFIRGKKKSHFSAQYCQHSEHLQWTVMGSKNITLAVKQENLGTK